MTRRTALEPLRLFGAALSTVPTRHVHWFRWSGDEPFGNGSRYECRCGVVRSGL